MGELKWQQNGPSEFGDQSKLDCHNHFRNALHPIIYMYINTLANYHFCSHFFSPLDSITAGIVVSLSRWLFSQSFCIKKSPVFDIPTFQCCPSVIGPQETVPAVLVPMDKGLQHGK